MVPKGGLEPPRVTSHAPQTCASTNSATSAIQKLSKNYFFGVGVVFAAGLLVAEADGLADSAALGCADGTDSEAAGEAFGDATGDGDATGAGSSAPAKTDFAPVITGNPSVKANNMYATAAPIVILARIV